jgi:transposase
MEAGTHSILVSQQLQEQGHEVIVANVRELRAISHSDRRSDQVDAEKLARYARLDPEILRPISHRTVFQQEALTLIRARNLVVRLRTAAVNAVRGLAKPCGYRFPASLTLCFAKRCMAALPPGLAQALGPVLEQIAEMTKKIKQLRPTHQAAYGDRVPRDPGVDPGLRRWPTHGANVCSHAGQQGTIPAKMVTQDAGIVIACPLRATGAMEFWRTLNAFSFLLRKF